MFHWFGVARNARGDALSGWQVGLVELDTQNVVAIFSDESSTPIAASSGVSNRAITDENGNYDFFVPSGTYTLQFYNPSGVFQRDQRFVAMFGADAANSAALASTAGSGLVGTSSGDTVQATINALNAADALRPTSSALAASTGSALIGTIASGTGAVARTVQAKLREIPSQADYATLSQAHDAAGGIKPVLGNDGTLWLGGARPSNIVASIESGVLKMRAETEAGENAGAGNGWQAAHLEIYEGVNCIDGVSTSSKVDGFRVLHFLNKASATGGRHAAQFTFVQNSATTAGNTDRNYVGAVGQAITTVGDGGVSGTPRGAFFGGNSYAASRGTSDWMANLTAHEFNTETRSGGRIGYHAGVQIASMASQRGTDVDAAIAVGRLGTTNPLDGDSATQTWREILCITNQNSATPVGSDTTIIKIDHTATVARFADFRNVTFTEPVLETNNIQLTETSFSIVSAGALVELGSKSASNTPSIDFNSSGDNFDYDARIIASAGGGSAGNGVLSILAQAVALPSMIELDAALVDAADDTAAASAGVGLRRLYRTGSVVKQRVA